MVGAGGGQASAGDGRSLRVSGEARNIAGGEQVQDDNVIVLYATTATVAALSGEPGYNRLAFRLRDASPAAAATTVEAVRRYLATVPGFAGFTKLPELRAPGDWPGKADTEKFAQLLSVITLLALLSALVLISNTMTTLVAEQTGEIGIMRAIGGRRRQIALVYLRTAAAARRARRAAGIVLGIVFSNLLAGYFGSTFWAIDVGFGVDVKVVLVSSPSACWRRRWRRCPRSGAATASTCARRSSRPARPSAARTRAIACCAAPASCRGRCRSACAASAGASGAASRRR